VGTHPSSHPEINPIPTGNTHLKHKKPATESSVAQESPESEEVLFSDQQLFWALSAHSATFCSNRRPGPRE